MGYLIVSFLQTDIPFLESIYLFEDVLDNKSHTITFVCLFVKISTVTSFHSGHHMQVLVVCISCVCVCVYVCV